VALSLENPKEFNIKSILSKLLSRMGLEKENMHLLDTVRVIRFHTGMSKNLG